MRSAVDSIPAELRSMFLPQAEQIGVNLRQASCGVCATADNDVCQGVMWVAPVGRDCLVSAHCLTPRRTFAMTECSERDFVCVASLSAPAADCLATIKSSRVYRSRDSVVAYSQPAGPVHFDMGAASTYRTAAISFLPSFFTRLADLLPAGCPAPEELFGSDTQAQGRVLNEEGRAAEALGALLGSLSTMNPEGPATQLRLHAGVTQALALLVEEACEDERAHAARGGTAQRDLVRRACAIVDAHLGDDLSLERLCRELLVSRSRLCAVFRQERGESVGAYIQRRRVERAKELLSQPDARVQEVAREVGYARQGSFAEMFRKATGMTPVQWRDAYGRG